MVTTSIGHSQMNISDELKRKLKSVITDCIAKGTDTFYCGGYGEFDSACASAVKELKEQYPNIKSYIIIPYLNPIVQKKLQYIEKRKIFDGSIYPELETVPLKFAISKRNEWMVDKADFVIAYVDHDWGGAWTTLQYAKRKKKTIVNLAE